MSYTAATASLTVNAGLLQAAGHPQQRAQLAQTSLKRRSIHCGCQRFRVS